MRLLFAAAEIYPLAKTGGLADVSAALPQALAALGIDVRLVMPAYPQALAAAVDKRRVAELPSFDRSIWSRVIEARMPDSGLPVWLIDCPALFDRPGTLYRDPQGNDWADNAQRFTRFCRVAAGIALGKVVPGWRADIVHANDWHTGLLPLLLDLSGEPRPPTVFTIHNLAYQGLFPPSVLPSLGLSDDLFTPDDLEFYGNVSFLKAGIRYSDRVTTVSPSYAREIMTPEYGCGLDGLLRHRGSRTTGILNGVDYRIWNPATDRHLPVPFTGTDLSGKRVCKADLQRDLGLDVEPARPLIVWLSRITGQKMADVVAHSLHAILERDVQLAILGEGEPGLEWQFRDAS